jgi:chromosomal replication initiator protein
MLNLVVCSPPAGGQVRASRIEDIRQHVARTLGMQVEELRVPRQLAMYLTKQLTDASLAEIGNHFGGKHHSTVMYSVAKIDPGQEAQQKPLRPFYARYTTLGGWRRLEVAETIQENRRK